MRQCGELHRHAERGELGFDEGAPAPRALQALSEAVGQAQLEADPSRRGAQLVIADVVGPEREHARFFCAQVIALAVRERRQDPGEGLAALLDATVALLAADSLGQVDALVHHAEIAIVVQYALVRAVAGEDRYPEIDVGL